MKPRAVETVRRAAQRVNIRNLRVESAMFAKKKTGWNRSVLHGLAYMEEADDDIIYAKALFSRVTRRALVHQA